VLAVEVDYETGKATIGTEKGKTISREAILDALKKKTPYRGRFVEE